MPMSFYPAMAGEMMSCVLGRRASMSSSTLWYYVVSCSVVPRYNTASSKKDVGEAEADFEVFVEDPKSVCEKSYTEGRLAARL